MSSKGPKWSEASVKVLLMLVRSKVEEAGRMSDEQLDKECGKRLELKKYVGQSQDMKAEALRDFIWKNALASEEVGPEPGDELAWLPGDIDGEVAKVVSLLLKHGSATPGGIKNMLYKNRSGAFLDEVLSHATLAGKIKKVKTTSGTEVIVPVPEPKETP